MKKLLNFPQLPDFKEIQLRGQLSITKEKRAGKEYRYTSIRIKDKELIELLPKEFTFSIKIPLQRPNCKGNKSNK